MIIRNRRGKSTPKSRKSSFFSIVILIFLSPDCRTDVPSLKCFRSDSFSSISFFVPSIEPVSIRASSSFFRVGAHSWTRSPFKSNHGVNFSFSPTTHSHFPEFSRSHSHSQRLERHDEFIVEVHECMHGKLFYEVMNLKWRYRLCWLFCCGSDIEPFMNQCRLPDVPDNLHNRFKVRLRAYNNSGKQVFDRKI